MRRSLVALVLAVTLPLPALAGQVTVKEGETLSQIAEQHGISLSRLMQINGIRNANQVEAGRSLTVPGASGGAASSSRSAAAGTVIVRPGETLSQIAERHGIGLSKLMQLNGITKANQVEAGQTLRIRAAAAPGSRSGATTTAATYPRGAKEHVVRSGESLSVIADGYGIGMSKLIALNGISDPNLVEAGTRLKLKGTPAAAPAARPAVTTATSRAATQPAARPQPSTAAATRPATASASSPAPASSASGAGAATTSRPTPAATATARPAPTSSATPATTQAAAATTVAMASPDWRSYGPLQVNWSAWQPMGGSMVAPTLNGQGQSLYLAINCGARKLNSTGSGGEWKAWSDPTADYEQQLVSDYCRSRG